MSKKRGFPNIKKENKRGVWRLYWYWGGKKYNAHTNINAEDKHKIEILTQLLYIQIASGSKPELSPPWDSSPSVLKYLNDRYGVTGHNTAKSDPSQWLTEYHHEIQGKISPGWAKESVAMLSTLRSAMPLHGISENSARFCRHKIFSQMQIHLICTMAKNELALFA